MQALVEAVRNRNELARRWYRTKAKLLGIERLADYDRMASVADIDEEFGWAEGSRLVLDAYASFSPALADVARRFIDERLKPRENAVAG